ncbi:MAG: peptidoglycan-binding protein LysM [Bosea sp. (in: a-proteobacteria)]
MGLFNFIKEAGSKLFGGSAKAATPDALQAELAKHGLPPDVQIDIQGDVVKVNGSVNSQEEAEKIILALGNTIGVAQVDANLFAADGQPEAAMYTVKKGDTLWKIAEMHYGKGQGAKYPEIVKANSPPVTNPDLIMPGWVLRLPAKATA